VDRKTFLLECARIVDTLLEPIEQFLRKGNDVPVTGFVGRF
jgi:nucleoid DNA-binding protein